MSLLGHDAIGHWALGHPPGGPTITVVVVTTASFAITANAVTNRLAENISPAAFVIAPQGVTDKELGAVSAASFAITTQAVKNEIFAPVTAAAFAITTKPVTTLEGEAVTPTSFAITFNNVPLLWTGQGIDPSYTGGVGHLLYEIEEAKRLAATTKRGPPGFVDLRSAPTFPAFGGQPSAPPAPPIDLQAIANQRAQMRAQKRRREAEAILLLAS